MFDVKSVPGVDKISKLFKKQKAVKYRKINEDVDAYFSQLGLNTAGEKLFENPAFFVWVGYVDNYTAKYPAKPNPMLPTLARRYHDEVLSKMLETARKVKSTEKVATILQRGQMKMRAWKNKGLTVDDIFKRCKLDRSSNPFGNPAINIVGRYSDEFTPGTTTLFKNLLKKYSDSTLSKMFIAARKAPDTENLGRILEDQLRRAWLNKLQSLDSVFKFLKLHKGVDNLLDRMELKSWLRFQDMFKFQARLNSSMKQQKLAEIPGSRYSSKAVETILKSATSAYGKNMAVVVRADLPTSPVA
ncbi:Avirulence (Avh) protein [Phytophthora megakarya]|uniref:Avirulence (Avh) protein n=1 Tax=Phytophthora megakarya TaxID=4795 RepID=A0A225W009_9STRA|nr:Avirulence (Avh) protein [Phytophthora megakarya]